MPLSAEAIVDILTTTLQELGPMKWTDLSTDIQEFHWMPNMIRKEKVKFTSGYEIRRNLKMQTGGAAHTMSMFGLDSRRRTDLMRTMKIPWRHVTTYYMWERRELAMNRDPAKLVDTLKLLRTDALEDLAILMEQIGWGKPESSDDEETPYGLLMYAVKNATTGFYGGNPAGFASGVGGVDSASYPRYRNYTFSYARMSNEDCIASLREAYAKCGFRSPVDHPSYNRGADRWVFYVNYATRRQMEDFARQQNDQLGRDLAAMDGRVVFNGNPVRWAPYLDADSTNPIYGVNWAKFYPVFLSGEYMREDPPEKVADQHTTFAVDIDCTYNVLCPDRRGLIVGAILG